MKKRVLSFLLCLVIASGCLAACASTQEKEEAVSETEVMEEAKTTETTEESAKEEKEMDTLEVFINMSWYPISEFEGIIPDLIREETGVDLDVTIATDSNQLGVMIASGDLPDLIFTDVELDRLSNASVCYSYEELEEKYGASFEDASDVVKNLARSFSSDGSYYTIQNAFSSTEELQSLKKGVAGQPGIYYRKDLVDQLETNEIHTVDDLMAALEECKTKFPDMVPLGINGVYKLQSLQTYLGVNSGRYNPETGDYYYIATTPTYKEYLQVANEMAQKEYFTAESYANDNDAEGEQAAYNGNCVFHSYYISNTAGIKKLEANTVVPEADWAVLPMLNGSHAIGTSGAWAGCFVSRNCSNPEAAARLLTYLHSIEGRHASIWGREGIDYTLDESGSPVFSEEYLTAQETGTIDQTYNTWFYFGSTFADELCATFASASDEDNEGFVTYAEGYINYPEIGAATPAASSDEGVIYAKLEELRKSYEAKIIFAESAEVFESTYQEFMDAIEKTGVNEYNAYMKQAIAEAKVTLGIQ